MFGEQTFAQLRTGRLTAVITADAPNLSDDNDNASPVGDNDAAALLRLEGSQEPAASIIADAPNVS